MKEKRIKKEEKNKRKGNIRSRNRKIIVVAGKLGRAEI
jgi:hypothetical protein